MIAKKLSTSTMTNDLNRAPMGSQMPGPATQTPMAPPAPGRIEIPGRAQPRAPHLEKASRIAPAGPTTGPAESMDQNSRGEVVRVLVIEDNPKIAATLRQGFTEQGYAVDVTHTGFSGEEAAASQPYDLVVLDVMLPDRDGVDVCKALRRRGVATPILMLTALSATTDKVSGLNAGADDYLTKPFEFDELLARSRALLRRGKAAESSVLRYRDVELDLTRRTVKRGEETINLTAKEFALLEYFMRNAGRVLTRTSIGEHVWDMNFEPTSNVIDVYVSMLRRKVDKGFDTPLIHTVIGTGYVFSDSKPG
jgi:two-component system copper resistance phosphate regulon response regulator CusR